MTDRLRDELDAVTVRRVYGEFLEMPGLRLTCRQAQRLCGLDEHTCRQLLDFLVETRFLWQADGVYSRRTEGSAEGPPSRMAKVVRATSVSGNAKQAV